MSYNNFDENRPNQNNGILTDIDSINEALNILREQGLSTNFPTNTTAGMPFARLETRDDNSLQDKVVVYRRNADDDDWLKVYDEEYGAISAVDADNVTGTYKGNDIDSDGDGKVDEAEHADNADKIEGQKIGEERFQISSNVGSEIVLAPGDIVAVYTIFVPIPTGKSLILKNARWTAPSPLENPDGIIRLEKFGDSLWEGLSTSREEKNINENLGSTSSITITVEYVNQNDTENLTLKRRDSFWFDFVIE